jgi:predicted nucleic acid-binding protein
MTRAFLDANVPIYSAGRPHPLKEPCIQVLDLAADHREAFVTDAEVLQELLHRYTALRIWPDVGAPLFRRFADLMRGHVEPLRASDVEDAARLADQHPRLSARDLVHVAVMQRLAITQIVTADTAFDGLPEIARLDPLNVSAWRSTVTD